MQSAPRTISAETITASTTGIWQNRKLTAAFQVTLSSRLNKRNSFVKRVFDFKTSEVRLVGGSGPHEGNILVGGLPVCDDGHDAQNALVVCRLAKKNLRHKETLISPFCIVFGPKSQEKFAQDAGIFFWANHSGIPLWIGL